MKANRRFFLKRGAVALAAIGASDLWRLGMFGRMALAAEAGGKRKVLVCIFQRGAADGLSMVVPHGDPFYYKHRNEIAVARPAKGGGADRAIDLDGFFGLNPALAAFDPLYKAGELAVVHACGSPNSSRSHFDMQDFMEAGVSDDKSLETGWLNRLVQSRPPAGKSTPFRAVSMTPVVPRSLQGDAEALAVRDLANFGVGTSGESGAASGFEGLYDGAVDGVLHGAGRESFEAISMLKKADPTQYKPAAGVKYPDGAFGRSMLQVAQLVKADVGMEVAFVETDGWDTHANQGSTAGQLAGRLYDLSRGIAAFRADLGTKFEDVMVLTMSEFGRSARQNGNRGTDHGHATCFFALGGGVRGGKVLGTWPGLAPEKLFESRDLAVTTDYRDVFAEAAAGQFGLKLEALARVFPGYEIRPERFRGICAAS